MVIRTSLRGFSVATFTRGFRRAYRAAFARRHGIVVLERVIITNVRDVARRSRRRLQVGGGIEFDCQVSAETEEAAIALNAEIKGGNTTEDAAVLDEFKQQIEALKGNPEYEDVPVTYAPPAALAIATSPGHTAIETVAPTPATTAAPASGGGAGSGTIIGGAIGAVACVGALAGVALWRRHRLAAAKERVQSAGGTSAKAAASEPELHMHEVYPNADATQTSEVL